MPGIALQRAQYAPLMLARPGSPAEVAGIVLLDPESDRLYIRLRRDWEALVEEALVEEEDAEYLGEVEADLSAKARELGASALLDHLQNSLSNLLLIGDPTPVAVHNFDAALTRLYRQHVTPKVLPFRTHLPQFSARAAAGRSGEHMEVEEEGWVEAPSGLRLTSDMFAAHVTGRSMLPVIPDGSLCVFRTFGAGSRQGRLVLVVNYGEPGENRFTVKRYRSSKRQSGDAWEHERIVLEPLNPEFEPWEIDEHSNVRVIAEFVQVLEKEEN